MVPRKQAGHMTCTRPQAKRHPTKNPQRHKMLLRLLAEEEAKEKK
jgi:hypothetical protein